MDKLLSIKCGYISNIPTCCIIFFETIWCKLIYPNEKLRKRYNKFNNHLEGYLHCPICVMLKRTKEIIDCDDKSKRPCNPCENKNAK
jgi:hypothetical protein